MKKIVFLSLISLIIISCGEIFKEETGSAFEGTWTLTESYKQVGDTTVRVYNKSGKVGGKFITSRRFGKENLLLFYSGGTYDSSFFYMLKDDMVYVRRITDSAEMKYVVPNLDSIISVEKPLKPLNPGDVDFYDDSYVYYGTYVFKEGVKLKMYIRRYALKPDGKVDMNNLLYEDVYERPEEE